MRYIHHEGFANRVSKTQATRTTSGTTQRFKIVPTELYLYNTTHDVCFICASTKYKIRSQSSAARANHLVDDNHNTNSARVNNTIINIIVDIHIHLNLLQVIYAAKANHQKPFTDCWQPSALQLSKQEDENPTITMLFSRAWRALMWRNMVYRKRNLFGSVRSESYVVDCRSLSLTWFLFLFHSSLSSFYPLPLLGF